MRINLALAVLVTVAGSAYAAPQIIDFSTGAATDNGTVTYAGGAAPLVGSNIGIGLVRGISTPSNAGVTDSITNGILSFQTGGFTSYNAGTDTYTFAPGGFIKITGTG